MMTNTGPIIIIDDDTDDQDMLIEVLAEIGIRNNHVAFNDCASALHYLSTTKDKPFLIFCDINMPKMNGLELRKNIDQDEFLKKKSIPFIFLSTAANKNQVDEAYELSVQGFFLKQNSIKDMKDSLQCILSYWSNCVHPNAATLYKS